MLDPKEREKIAQRVKDELDKDYIDYADLYEAITGECVSIGRPFDYYHRMMLSFVLYLCDTSNMVELPLDKNGVPIHIGDTVWCDGDKYQVASIRYDTSGLFDVEVYIRSDAEMFRAFWRRPKAVTHTELISDHERIAQEIEEIADANKGSVTEEDLRLVAEQIRELGDNND